MKIAILGFGIQGKSSLGYFSKDSENQITICDQKLGKKIPDGVEVRRGDSYLDNLSDFDLIVRSPSVHPSDIIRAGGEQILEKVTTNTNEFFRVCPTKNIIGVTGTKGKGTTSSLIAKMLEAAGNKVHLGGNIGISPLDMLPGIGPDDWVVLELANFQLIDLKYSPHVAACLMVVPEHMDWHTDMDEYVTAKQQLFRWQEEDDVAIYFAKNDHSKEVVSVSRGQKIPYYAPPGAIIENDDVVIDGQSICSTDEIKLLGQHNWQNVCAAVTAVWQVTQDVEAIRSAITTFSGMEHRLELVRELDGIKYYDDSFGTTPETAIVAIEAFAEPKVVILGGSDKGADFGELAQTVAHNNVRHVITIGHTGPKIAQELEKAGFTSITQGPDTMPDIVTTAQQHAKQGDIVLLSTGSASFGLFKNYKDRGEQFKQAVQSLSSAAG